MKKLLIVALCFIFIATGSLPIFANNATNITVSSTASSVLVDGEDVAFDAYNIGGNNYFKLRDLAYVLNGTEKQFEVGFDSAKNAIMLTSGEEYTPVGGEMSGGNNSNTVTPATAQIYLDGREIKLTAYNIGGSNYFKLRDLGEAVNFGVSYDNVKKMIIIDSSKNYWTMETKEIVINPNSEYKLPGTFTLPVGGEGPRPVVIIVHGSGPGNRDGEVGTIKMYKDLAEQLASHGIASIRYDKRTLVHGQKMVTDVNLTVKEETIDDVIYAAELALTLGNIDKDKIYVAGHSLGGYLIPRIYAADTANIIAGYISLAGAARPLTELMAEQFKYLSTLDIYSVLDKAYIKSQAKELEKVAKLTEADKGKNTAILGAYPTYWLDLAAYNPSEEIKKVDKPLLFLQGGTDYQVTEVDFNLFKNALKGRDDAKFILYPNLTHCFTYTEKKSIPTDYMIDATVDKQVAWDIANFINNND